MPALARLTYFVLPLQELPDVKAHRMLPRSAAAHPKILEPRGPQSLGLIYVSEIYDIRFSHELLQPIDIKTSKLIPLGNDDKPIAAMSRGVLILAVMHVRQNPARGLHCSRVVGPDPRASRRQVVDYLDRRSLSDVVRVRFEREFE